MHLRLPATTANLGPGFDAVALALQLYLDVGAEAAPEFRIEASGRSPEICGAPENNLLLETYRGILREQERPVIPLSLRMHNEIPLGMGCGSSAAVRLAGVAMASHFGELAWNRDRILVEACRLESHPDNAAACWMGGFVVSVLDQEEVKAVSMAPPADWSAVLVLPGRPLATTASRGLLPESYGRATVVANLQRVGLLTAAFATGRGDLLTVAMEDQVHQPYRSEVCPLLGQLLPLAGQSGILGVALSGAGPAVLLLVSSRGGAAEAQRVVARAVREPAEILLCGLEAQPAVSESEDPLLSVGR
ncbi:MAG TPA: homoserine kinase [Acidobacteriaceae bacterium]|nr:homoserine kinase [Acidobacteriaceae bacterium]